MFCWGNGWTLNQDAMEGVIPMEVRAELTATVWKVVVEQGATVAEGDELVILESMKMEIPVAAPVAGTVTELCVAEEDRINEVV